MEILIDNNEGTDLGVSITGQQMLEIDGRRP